MDIHAEELTPEDVARLPALVRDIERVAGLPAAIAVVNAFRGMEISIPKGENNNTSGKAAFERIAAAAGRDAALAICNEFGGEMLSIPRCHTLRTEIRARAIRRAFDDGEDINTLARHFEMTYRAIEIILNRAI
ncbi:MAG: Mor transcription activator family protein [Pseudomonadota bacterium]|jgi:hypothetical protein